MNYGDRVRFVLAPDIEGIVVAMLVEGRQWQYQIAWIDQGERKTAWCHASEIQHLKQ